MPASQTLPGILGSWVEPEWTGSEISFDLPSSPLTDAPTWRLDLPRDPQAAAERLERAAGELQAYQVALASVPGRIDGLVQQVGSNNQIAVSYSAGITVGLPQPEVELLQLLESSDLVLAAKTAAGLSFAISEADDSWQSARRGFEGALNRLLRLIAYWAHVETLREGRAFARTVVSWTGAVETFWSQDLAVEQFALHSRSLSLALASRAMLMNMLAITTQGAVKLSFLLATPGGAVLALPAAWRFINQVLAEYQKYQTITASTGG